MYEHRTRPMSEFQERLGNLTVQVMSGLNIIAYQLSDGRVGGQVPSGAPICLLTTTGRRTGRPRTVPLLFLWDADDTSPDGSDHTTYHTMADHTMADHTMADHTMADMIIVASNGGMSRPPYWYLNLQADNRVTVTVDGWHQDRRATPVGDGERPELWRRLVNAYLHFEHYEARTDRRIPVLRLRATGPRRPKASLR